MMSIITAALAFYGISQPIAILAGRLSHVLENTNGAQTKSNCTANVLSETCSEGYVDYQAGDEVEEKSQG